jgi:PEP-CTERM motif
MKRLITLLLLFPALAVAQETFYVTSGSGSMTSEDGLAVLTFTAAGNGFSESGGLCLSGGGDCSFSTLGRPLSPGQPFSFSIENGTSGDFYASLTLHGVPWAYPEFTCCNGNANASFDGGAGPITGPGTYHGQFSFSGNFYGVPLSELLANPDVGCNVFDYCTNFDFFGGGTVTANVVPFPYIPGDFEVTQATLTFTAPEPSLASLLLIALAALGTQAALRRPLTGLVRLRSFFYTAKKWSAPVGVRSGVSMYPGTQWIAALVALLLLAPVLARAQDVTIGAITSGSAAFDYTDPGVTFGVAGSNFTAGAGMFWIGEACCNPLAERIVTPGQSFGAGFGGNSDGGGLFVNISGLDNLTYDGDNPNSVFGSANAGFGIGPVVINHVGTYFAPFTFTAGIFGFPANSPPGTSCETVVCSIENIQGGGIATLDVVPYPNIPNALLVEHATLTFIAPEPSTTSLMLIALAGLVGWRLARERIRGLPRRSPLECESEFVRHRSSGPSIQQSLLRLALPSPEPASRSAI